MKAQTGHVVTVHYTGKFEETQQVFDSSEGRDPLQFTIGANMVIPGFENAVLGKEVGDRTNVIVTPEQGYGPRHQEAIMTIPKDALEGVEPEVGQQLGLEDESGNHHAAIVAEIGEDTVTLDFNHFLAGRTLQFEIELVSIAE